MFKYIRKSTGAEPTVEGQTEEAKAEDEAKPAEQTTEATDDKKEEPATTEQTAEEQKPAENEEKSAESGVEEKAEEQKEAKGQEKQDGGAEGKSAEPEVKEAGAGAEPEVVKPVGVEEGAQSGEDSAVSGGQEVDPTTESNAETRPEGASLEEIGRASCRERV